MLGVFLLITLTLVVLGALPHWPHSKEWGYMPSSALGIVLLIVFLLWLFGRA